MSLLKYLAVAVAAIGTVSAMQAETRCPGNVASIRPRFVEHSIVIVPVMVNESGPYDFVLDTAAQVTTIEPSLADELHLKLEGTAGVTGGGFFTRAAYARPELLGVGDHGMKNPLVLVHPLGQIEISDRRVRGVLGENFLEQFDLLIDYDRAMVCLDNKKVLQQKIKGKHLALVAPMRGDSHLPFTQPLILNVDVPGNSVRSLLLQLDSGINVPLLFDASTQGVSHPAGRLLQSRGTDGMSHGYVVLPAEDIQVGPHRLQHVSFVAPARRSNDVPRSGIDGVLPTGLFRSVFISYEGQFAVVAPW